MRITDWLTPPARTGLASFADPGWGADKPNQANHHFLAKRFFYFQPRRSSALGVLVGNKKGPMKGPVVICRIRLVEDNGFEPLTLARNAPCSGQLS
jgi:hypothetical protein